MMELSNAEFGHDRSEVYPTLRLMADGNWIEINLAETSNNKWRDYIGGIWLGPEWEGKVPDIKYLTPGYPPDRALTLRGYTTDPRIVELYDRLLDASFSGRYEDFVGPQKILPYAEAVAKVQENTRQRQEENRRAEEIDKERWARTPQP